MLQVAKNHNFSVQLEKNFVSVKKGSQIRNSLTVRENSSLIYVELVKTRILSLSLIKTYLCKTVRGIYYSYLTVKGY